MQPERDGAERPEAAKADAARDPLREAETLLADNLARRLRLRGTRSATWGERPDGRLEVDAEVALPMDSRAPGAARLVVAGTLRGRVVDDVLDDAQLVVSELVSNGVFHSGVAGPAMLVVGVQLDRTTIRLGVQDPGRGGLFASAHADLDGGGGLGLRVVQWLAERWGLERVGTGGTRVWADLSRTARLEPDLPSDDAPPLRAVP